jgi:hypothetical protein
LRQSPAWRIHFKVGDRVNFINASSLASAWSHRTLTRAWYNPNADGGAWVLGLDKPLDPSNPLFTSPPTKLGLVNTAHLTKNLIIRNVTTHNHRARGFVVQIKENAVVEFCTVDRVQMAGIMVRACAANSEGLGVKKMMIGYNTLRSADAVGWNGAIEVESMDKNWLHMYSPLNSDVTIRNNGIFNVVSNAVFADSVSKISVINNRISVDKSPPFDPDVAGAIKITRSTDVKRSGNKW